MPAALPDPPFIPRQAVVRDRQPVAMKAPVVTVPHKWWEGSSFDPSSCTSTPLSAPPRERSISVPSKPSVWSLSPPQLLSLFPCSLWCLPQLRDKYGPVFTVYLGPRRVVILCGHQAVKEALVDQAEEFSGRGELATIDRNFNGFGE